MSGNQTTYPYQTGYVTDTTFQTQMNNQNKILAQISTTMAAINTLLGTVAIIPAPTAGAVGSYAMAKASAVVGYGATVPGADLTPTNAAGGSAGAALTGTWQCMGEIGAAGDVALFVRAS